MTYTTPTEKDIQQRKELGAYFRQLREEERLGQRELAQVLGTSQVRVSEFENGTKDFHISTLQRFARAFGLKVVFRLESDLDPEQEAFNELLRAAMAELEEENS